MFFRRVVFYRSRFGFRVWRVVVVVVCFLVVASLLPVGGGGVVSQSLPHSLAAPVPAGSSVAICRQHTLPEGYGYEVFTSIVCPTTDALIWSPPPIPETYEPNVLPGVYFAVASGDSGWSYGLEIIFAGTSANPQAVQFSAYFPSGGFRVRVSGSSYLDLGCQANGFFGNLVSEARNLVYRCAGSLPASFKTALDGTARADFVFRGSEPASSTTTTTTVPTSTTTTTTTTSTTVPAGPTAPVDPAPTTTTTTAVPAGPSAPVDPVPEEPAPAVPVFPVVEPADTVVPTASGELGGYLLPLPVGAYFGLTQSSSDSSGRSFNSSFACSAEQSCYSVSLALGSSGEVYTAELRLALNGDPGVNRSRIALGDWHFIRHGMAPLKLVCRDQSFFRDDTASSDSYVRPQASNAQTLYVCRNVITQAQFDALSVDDSDLDNVLRFTESAGTSSAGSFVTPRFVVPATPAPAAVAPTAEGQLGGFSLPLPRNNLMRLP